MSVAQELKASLYFFIFVMFHFTSQIAAADEAEYSIKLTEYRSCLNNNARSLAVSSAERADIIARAALASCPMKRIPVLAASSKLGIHPTDERLSAYENSTFPELLLLVLKARGAVISDQ